MQGYAPGQDEAFAKSRNCFGELEHWLGSEEAAGLQHGELEEQLDVRGRALLRQLFQDRLDLTAAREERRHDVTGQDGVVRTRAERGRTRPLVTRFGQVRVSRIAYRSPGRRNVHPLDAVLNLPEEKHSHGLRSPADRLRVAAAHHAAAIEGRFLGGRPPYGYRIADAGPHPNPAKAADGKRLHKLEPDPETAWVVRRIFAEYLAGRGLFAIAEGLTRDAIPSPSQHDAARNTHRTGEGWAKSAVRAILRNPRYTGRQVWNKQRKDEILLDVNDLARGYETRLRWNDIGQWVWSETLAQEPLVSAGDFEAAQAIMAGAGRARQASHETRERVRNPYALRGRLYCGFCERRMQGQYNHGVAYYRCRYPKEYALASHVRHPGNVYLREADVLHAIDRWLIVIFAPAGSPAPSPRCKQPRPRPPHPSPPRQPGTPRPPSPTATPASPATRPPSTPGATPRPSPNGPARSKPNAPQHSPATPPRPSATPAAGSPTTTSAPSSPPSATCATSSATPGPPRRQPSTTSSTSRSPSNPEKQKSGPKSPSARRTM